MRDILKYTRIAGVVLIVASMWALGIVLDGGLGDGEGVCFQSSDAPDDPYVCQGLGLSDRQALWVAPIAIIIGACLWYYTPRWRRMALTSAGAVKRRRNLFRSLYYPRAHAVYVDHWDTMQATGTCNLRHRSPGRCLLDAHWTAAREAIGNMSRTDPLVRESGVDRDSLDVYLGELADWANLKPEHLETGWAEMREEHERERQREARTAELLARQQGRPVD